MSRNAACHRRALGPGGGQPPETADPHANDHDLTKTSIFACGCGIPYYAAWRNQFVGRPALHDHGPCAPSSISEHGGVQVLNQTRVTAIDCAAKTVTATSRSRSEERPYDRLIIATRQHSQSASPVIPRLKTWAVRTTSDADALRKACASGSVQNAVWSSAPGSRLAWKRRGPADMWGHHISVVEFMPQAGARR